MNHDVLEKTWERPEKTLNLYPRLIINTEVAFKNQKNKNNIKKEKMIGKAENLIYRVTTLLDANVYFSTTTKITRK